MTDKQWNALLRMTKGWYFSSTLSVGTVTLREIPNGFELEYPSYSVPLYKDSSISGTDLHYLRYLYNEWLTTIQ